MTYQAYELREIYKSDPQKLEAFIGQPATAGLYAEDGSLIASCTGLVTAITVVEGGVYPGVPGRVEGVAFDKVDRPLSTEADPGSGSYIIISGDIS